MTAQARGAPAAEVLGEGQSCRDFHWTDIPAAVAIEPEAFPYDPWSAETFWSELAQVPARARYLAVSTGGQLDAYAGMTFIGTDAHLQTVAVASKLRGRGIGAGLLAALVAEAAERGVERCLLEVKPDNSAAIGLYEKFGFTKLGTRPGYFPGGEEALVLQLVLGGSS